MVWVEKKRQQATAVSHNSSVFYQVCVEKFTEENLKFNNTLPHLINVSPHFVNTPTHFINEPPHFVNTPPYFINETPHFVNTPPHFVNTPPHFINEPPQPANTGLCVFYAKPKKEALKAV